MPLDDTTKHYEQALAPQADPFTLPALIAWLRTKPSGARYQWADVNKCMLGQYAREHGGGRDRRNGYYIGSARLPDPDHVADSPAHQVALHGENTFGAALARAEALAKSEGRR